MSTDFRSRHPFLWGMAQTFGIFQPRRQVPTVEETMAAVADDLRTAVARVCLCDGGSYEIRRHPFVVHTRCPIHGDSVGQRFVDRRRHDCGCITVWDWKYDKSLFEHACDDHAVYVADKDWVS